MKALEFLKSTIDEMPNEWRKYAFEAIEELYRISDEMASLESRSCAGCKEGWEREKQTFHKFYCEYLRIPVHSDFYCNRYKPKEQMEVIKNEKNS